MSKKWTSRGIWSREMPNENASTAGGFGYAQIYALFSLEIASQLSYHFISLPHRPYPVE